jgi:NitT/TauT family transport system substrate-binding protein
MLRRSIIIGRWAPGDLPARRHWVTSLSRGPMELFAEGKIDAFVAISPALQEVRARNIGHVIVSSLADRPWSQCYCCFFAARTDFARAYPVATRRVLRAILKAADLCAGSINECGMGYV